MESRSHENSIRLEVPVSEVWRALTDPVELARWFAPRMTVEPGEGGFVVADWGPGLEWKTRIEIWEPARRLRLAETRDRVMSSAPGEHKLEPCRLVQDYFLEPAAGATVLRLVHSGFGSGEGWDNEFEGTRSGWASCFHRMKDSLERHRGEPLENFLFTRTIGGEHPAAVLRRIEEAPRGEGETLLRTASHLQWRFPARNGSILTLSAQPMRGGTILYVEWLVYQPQATSRADLEREWKNHLSALFEV